MPDLIHNISARSFSIAITIVTAVTSIIALNKRSVYLKLILHPVSVIRGREYYRIITSVLIHNDMFHLFINSAMLIFVGGELEEYLNGRSGIGSLYCFLIYLISHLAGAIAVTRSNRSDYDYSSAGASGGILGCMMAFMLLAPDRIAFYLPEVGSISNQFAALILIIGLIIYKWRTENKLLDNELHFFSALGGSLITVALFPGLL